MSNKKNKEGVLKLYVKPKLGEEAESGFAASTLPRSLPIKQPQKKSQPPKSKTPPPPTAPSSSPPPTATTEVKSATVGVPSSTSPSGETASTAEPKKQKVAETTKRPKARHQHQHAPASSSPSAEGRLRCDCYGTTHTALGNCLGCGRIVCEMEGWGRCPFCGTMVSAPLGRKKSSAKPATAPATSASAASTAGIEKAMKLKETLLEYDRTMAKRTMIIDDQSDYFVASDFSTPAERQAHQEQLRAKREADKKKQQQRQSTFVTFDFSGRRVVVTDAPPPPPSQPSESSSSSAQVKQLAAPQALPKPTFTPTNGDSHNNNKRPQAPPQPATVQRVQHDYFVVESSPLDDDKQQQPQQQSWIMPLRGVVDGVVYPSSRLPEQQRNSLLLPLMQRKRMNHFLYAFNSATDTVASIKQLHGLCESHAVDFNLAVNLPEFTTELEPSPDALIAQLAPFKEMGVSCFSFIGQPIKDAQHTQLKIASCQSRLVNLVVNKLTTATASTTSFFFMPSTTTRESWQLLDKELGKTLIILVASPDYSAPSVVEDSFGDELNDTWPDRKLVLLDGLPSNPASLPCLRPYAGRSPLLTHCLDGLLVTVPVTPAVALWQVPLSTAFDFLSNPVIYNPTSSLLAVLQTLLVDLKLVEAFFDLLEIYPCSPMSCPDPNLLHHISTTAFRTPTSHLEFTTKLRHVEQWIPDSFRPDIEVFVKQIAAVLSSQQQPN